MLTLLILPTVIVFKFKKSKVAAAAILNKYSAVAEMGDRLAKIDRDRKLRCCAPMESGSWVPI